MFVLVEDRQPHYSIHRGSLTDRCIFHVPTCTRVSVCVCECGCVCMCVCMYAFVCDDFLLFPYYFFFHPPPLFFFLFSPSLSRLSPFSPLPCMCVCVCVCGVFPLSLPTRLKAALHHTSPLHSPSCFDLCYQGISCVRLMFFFLRVLRFSHSSLGMFGTGFLLFLFQGRT